MQSVSVPRRASSWVRCSAVAILKVPMFEEGFCCFILPRAPQIMQPVPQGSSPLTEALLWSGDRLCELKKSVRQTQSAAQSGFPPPDLCLASGSPQALGRGGLREQSRAPCHSAHLFSRSTSPSSLG